jgi:hypothetical protein
MSNYRKIVSEYFNPCSKKGRGRARRSLDLIEAMHDAAEAAQPITGRGIGRRTCDPGGDEIVEPNNRSGNH